MQQATEVWAAFWTDETATDWRARHKQELLEPANMTHEQAIVKLESLVRCGNPGADLQRKGDSFFADSPFRGLGHLTRVSAAEAAKAWGLVLTARAETASEDLAGDDPNRFAQAMRSPEVQESDIVRACERIAAARKTAKE